jgi:hypothetical protein
MATPICRWVVYPVMAIFRACRFVSFPCFFALAHRSSGLLLDELEERLYLRVRSQCLDRVEVFRQVLLAEERMNHSVADFTHADDGERFGVGFVTLLPPALLGVKVMARDLAIEQAAAYERKDDAQ